MPDQYKVYEENGKWLVIYLMNDNVVATFDNESDAQLECLKRNRKI
jgi:hypothetical protein